MESLSWWLCVYCNLFPFSCVCVCVCAPVNTLCWVSLCWGKSFSLLGWMLTSVRINHYQSLCVAELNCVTSFCVTGEDEVGFVLLACLIADCCLGASSWCLSCDWMPGLFVATDVSSEFVFLELNGYVQLKIPCWTSSKRAPPGWSSECGFLVSFVPRGPSIAPLALTALSVNAAARRLASTMEATQVNLSLYFQRLWAGRLVQGVASCDNEPCRNQSS